MASIGSEKRTRFARDWGDEPVVVLTRSKFPPIAGMTEAAREAFEARVREGHNGTLKMAGSDQRMQFVGDI